MDSAPAKKPIQGLQKKADAMKDDAQAAAQKALPAGVPRPGAPPRFYTHCSAIT